MISVILNNISDIENGYVIQVPCSKDQSTNQFLVEAIKCLQNDLNYTKSISLELVEILFSDGQPCKERYICEDEYPYVIKKLWPQPINQPSSYKYEFVLRPKTQNYITYNSLNTRKKDKYLTGLMTTRRTRDYQDLCNLPELNEITLLDNLKRRFLMNNIYTFIGSILISINPFHYFPIYNPKDIELYQNKKLADLPPHVFAIADAAYYNMMTTKTNQCIVISGESGSGKTENSNFLLHHLSALSQRNFYSNGIEKNITGVGPVLEAFGNAKTVHNNNSSRFGKFVQVTYREDGTVSGTFVYRATVEKYLLEKSRIVSQAPNERFLFIKYFIFLLLNDYPWLSMDAEHEINEFDRLKNAMTAVGFTAGIQQRLFTVLSAILNIGNIEFKKQIEAGRHDESTSISNMKQLQIVSNLLKVTEKSLLEALTKRRTMAGGETVVMANKIDEAVSTRNATAKCLYNALFDWIVYQINAVLLAKHDLSKLMRKYIGVLDIFGFEDFQFNSFEQFCINYANENLHFYFNQHIFKLEQEEYIKEGIYWENIEFIDNTGCLDLFNKKPSGLLHLLDEESNLPCGSNEILLGKFHAAHQSNAYYDVPHRKQNAFIILHYAGKVKYYIQEFREKNTDLMRNDVVMLLKSSKMEFIRELVGQNVVAIMRWAMLRIFFKAFFAFMGIASKCISERDSRVATGFPANSKSCLMKNRKNERLEKADSFCRTTFDVLSMCLHEFHLVYFFFMLIEKFGHDMCDIPTRNEKNQNVQAEDKHMQEVKAFQHSKLPLSSRSSKSKNKPPSISAQFHNSLMLLTDTLNQATPFFIRCIKSNQDKAAKVFDDELVERQLRYTGMLATVKIRQSGYNYRLSIEDFVYSFHVLLPNGKRSTKEDINKYLNQLSINKKNFQIGHTKVFLREAEKIYLEELLHEALLKKIVIIQRWFKMLWSRKVFQKVNLSIILTQSYMRGHLARIRFSQLRLQWSASVLIQSFFKMHFAKKKYLRAIKMHECLLRTCKMYLAQQNLKKHSALHFQFLQQNTTASDNRTETDCSDRSGKDHLLIAANEGEGDSCNVLHPAGPSYSKDDFLDIIRSSDPSIKSNDNVDDQREGLSRILFVNSKNPSRESYDIAYNTGRFANEARRKKKKNHFIEDHDAVDAVASENETTIIEDIYENEVDCRLSSLNDLHSYDPHASFTSQHERQRNDMHDVAMEGDKISASVKMQHGLSHLTRHSINDPSENETNKTSSQAGPADVEVLVVPAIEHVNNYDGNDSQDVFVISSAFQEKHVKAPLADEENFNDDDLVALTGDNDLDCEVKIVSIDDDDEDGEVTESVNVSTHPSENLPQHNLFSDPIGSLNEKLSVAFMKNEKSKVKPSRSRKLSVVKQRQEQKMSWNVAGTMQWKYPLDLVIENLKELRQFEHHLSIKKLNTYKLNRERGGKKENIIDEIFKSTLNEFHNNLLTQISTAKESSASEYVVFSYERLMKLVEEILRVKSRNKFEDDNDFPHTFFINAFRGFLDEFIKKKENKELPDIKFKNVFKKSKKESIFEHMEHKFLLIQFGIATFCECCQGKLWVLEKGYTCKVCMLTIHRKCYSKLNSKCSKSSDAASLVARKGHKIIGSPLSLLMQSLVDIHKVHPLIDRLISTIEMDGLYTEGLYRKVGLESATKKLIADINSNAAEQVDFSNQSIHVLTSVLKTFFREMPEPLLTFEFYKDFIRFADIEDENDRTVALYSLVDKLPPINHAFLERLIFHLAKVALQQEYNRMSAEGLAIIFAPSILRTSQQLPMQESLLHVPRQSLCVECLITSQMRKTQSTLRYIEDINKDTIDVNNKIATLKANGKRVSTEDLKVEDDLNSSISSDELTTLTHKMKTLQRKKQVLTAALSSMPCHRSLIDDGLQSSEDLDSMVGDEDASSCSLGIYDNISQYSDTDSVTYAQ
ncbi:hypothetical protein HELRODRAFT_190322 [Helobdella robusta]|uniref:Myosin motor domain-containing protein n=1 Tax=Helobdella robusta TaxID=6412 RepID=T1FRW8_HELRO|nr:hypothetical protein HELRODRAFT_190322 [Helobdella robusta]ESO09899.1 hypothetical protein HELRODRAFT_190322 [Helobdella robusta]